MDTKYQGYCQDEMGDLDSYETRKYATAEEAHHAAERLLARKMAGCPETKSRYSINVREIN